MNIISWNGLSSEEENDRVQYEKPDLSQFMKLAEGIYLIGSDSDLAFSQMLEHTKQMYLSMKRNTLEMQLQLIIQTILVYVLFLIIIYIFLLLSKNNKYDFSIFFITFLKEIFRR